MLDLDPGEYGFYVWTAYGLSVAGLAWLAASSLAFARHWRRRAESLEARAAGEDGEGGRP